MDQHLVSKTGQTPDSKKVAAAHLHLILEEIRNLKGFPPPAQGCGPPTEPAQRSSFLKISNERTSDCILTAQ
ncbi:MAG: hypothetical protein ACKVJU_05455 [Verrucomicrobiales bacterium]